MKTFFVSSTFSDMQFERDAIQEIALPKINAEAKKYGQSVSFCDLRWGIDTLEYSGPASDEREREERNDRRILRIADVCLDEIDRCKPPMIVILGDRYGTVPKAEIIREASARKNLFLDDYELSLTALEIEYGSLCPARRDSPAFFYERRIVNPEEAPAQYRESEERYRRKLGELKERVENFRTYEVSFRDGTPQGLETFAELLARDVIDYLRPQWEEIARSTPFERERAMHWRFIEERGATFCGRGEVLETVLNELGRRETVIVKGDTGSGKSALFCALALKLREMGWDVYPVVGGLTVSSNDAFDIVRGAVYYLEEKLGVPHFLEEKNEDGQPVVHRINEWRERLGVLGSRYSKDKKFIVMLDAPERLLADSDRASLAFIPPLLNSSFRFFMTCNSDFREINLGYLSLGPLTSEDKTEVIHGILSGYGKSLDKNVLSEMVSLKASENPLYLSFLVQRLAMMDRDDFTALRSLGRGMEAISAYQCKIVREAPSAPDGLCAELLKEAGDRIDPELVKAAAEYLAASRYGLRETDLAILLGEKWKPLLFSQFISYMQNCFFLRDDGRIDFTHQSIREGILERTKDLGRVRSDLLRLFERLPADDFLRLEETVYQAYLANDRAAFRSFVNSIRFEEIPFEQNPLAQFVKNCYSLAAEHGPGWFIVAIDETPVSAEYADFVKNMNMIDTFFLVAQQHAEVCVGIQEHLYDYAVKFFAKVEDREEVLPKACALLALAFQRTLDPLLIPKATPLLLQTAEYYRKQYEEGRQDAKKAYFGFLPSLGGQYSSTREPQLAEEVERAIQIAAESDDPETRLSFYVCKNLKAIMAFSDGDYQRSLSLEFEAIDLLESLFESLPPESLAYAVMLISSYGMSYVERYVQEDIFDSIYKMSEDATEDEDEEKDEEDEDYDEEDEFLRAILESQRFFSDCFGEEKEDKKPRKELLSIAEKFFARALDFAKRISDKGLQDGELFAMILEVLKCEIYIGEEEYDRAIEKLTELEQRISAINDREYSVFSRTGHCFTLGELAAAYFCVNRYQEAFDCALRAQRELDGLELISHAPMVLSAENMIYQTLTQILSEHSEWMGAREGAELYRRAILRLEKNPLAQTGIDFVLLNLADSGLGFLFEQEEEWKEKEEIMLFFAEKIYEILSRIDPQRTLRETYMMRWSADRFILRANGLEEPVDITDVRRYNLYFANVMFDAVELVYKICIEMDGCELFPEQQFDLLTTATEQLTGLMLLCRAYGREDTYEALEKLSDLIDARAFFLMSQFPQDEE